MKLCEKEFNIFNIKWERAVPMLFELMQLCAKCLYYIQCKQLCEIKMVKIYDIIMGTGVPLLFKMIKL